MKTLVCIAPDGASVNEGDFPSVESAWNRASDMGSRWFFYPINVVVGSRSPRARIADVPHGMPKEWVGKSIATLRKAIAADSEHACAYANGETPFCVFPSGSVFA